MRKSPTISKSKICLRCNNEFIPSGNRQFYCNDCRPLIVKETKQRHYLKNNPNAYSEKEEKTCSVCGEKFVSHFNGIPYCNKHYLKAKFYGDALYTRKSKNTFDIKGDYVEVKTTKNESFLIDLSDLEKVLNYTWCISKTGYLVANINNKVTKLHRYILHLSSNLVIDHINGNPLDNRRCNLRMCSQLENSRNLKTKTNNSSGFPGIRITTHNKYNVRITVNRKEIHLGNYSTLEEAKEARKQAELKYYGNFAPSKRTT